MRLHFCLFLLITCQSAFGQSEIATLASWKIDYDSAQYYWSADIEKSIVLFRKAEQAAFNDLGIYDENYLVILNDLGLAYSKLKNYTKAEEYLTRNLAIRHELDMTESAQTLQANGNLASVILKSGDDIRSKKLYKSILVQAEKLEVEDIYVTASENLSNLYEVQEHYDSALFVVQRALNTSFSNPMIQTHYKLHLLESRLLRKRKRYADASRKLEVLSKSIYSTPLDVSTLPYAVQMEQSLIHLETGLYSRAEKELLELYRSLKSQSMPDDALLTELTNSLAYTYDKLGVYDKAWLYYQESFSRCLKAYGYNSLSCAIMQNNMAGILLKQGHTTQAISQYEEFLEVYKKLSKENTSIYQVALNNLATAYRQTGQHNKALEYYRQLYNTLSDQHQLDSDLAATVMNNLGVTYMLQGNYTAAAENFEKVIGIKEGFYGADSPVLVDVLENLAVTNWVAGKHEQALPLFRRSLTIAEREIRYIFPNLTETEQVQFYQRKKLSFERFNTLALQHVNEMPELATQMFNNQLLLKSIVFFTNRKRNEKVRSNSKLKNLIDRSETVRAQLGHLYQLSSEEVNALNISTTKLETEIDSLEKVIRHELSEELLIDKHYTWMDVQRSLKADEVLVDLVRFRKYDVFKTRSELLSQQVNTGFTDSIYYAALITTSETTNSPKLVLLRNGYNLEHRNHRYYVNTLAVDVDDTVSYAAYWEDIERAVSGKKKIFLTPDGIYHQVNLNTLHDRKNIYVLEKFDIHLMLNPTQLVNRKPFEPIDFTKSVLMGDPVFTQQFEGYSYDPLPGSNAEVKEILKALRLTNTQPFLRHAASEVNLRKVHSPALLHIATHGFFSDGIVKLNEYVKNDFMFHSGLILAADNSKDFDRDGVVTAYDVAGLDLSGTQLVVLSACETGLGKIEHSEGVFGLQRAFLQAGVKAISISLWKVEDLMTKELMMKFYSYLAKLQNPQSALKQAQLDLLHEGKSPRLWGGFVMVNGD